MAKKYWAIRLSSRIKLVEDFVPYQEMYYDKRSEMRSAWNELNPVIKGVTSKSFTAKRYRVTEYNLLETKTYDPAR